MAPIPPRVVVEYERREEEASARLHEHLRQVRLWRGLVAGGVVLALLWLAAAVYASRRAAPAGWMFAAALVFLPVWLRCRRKAEATRRQVQFYAGCIERASGRKPQTGRTGEHLAATLMTQAEASLPESHAPDLHVRDLPVRDLYARDLAVTGANSLFGLLATVRTAWGEDALMRLLLRDVTADTVRARQEAVRELAPQIALREEVALLGSAPLGIAPVGNLEAWLERDSHRFPRWLGPVLLLTTLGGIALLITGLVKQWPGGLLLRNLLVIYAAQMLVSWRFRAEVLRELDAAKHLGAGIGILREGLQLLCRQRFAAEGLQQLQATSKEQRGNALGRLERVLVLAEQRETGWIFAVGLFLAAGTQAAIALAGFRERYGAALKRQKQCWAEFEALVAVATYAGEHDETVYPEMVQHAGGATFEAVALKHPLLPAEQAVGNDLALSGQEREAGARFLLISGSNMSGKSTLLRALGLCVVLARTGAPVPARSVRLSSLRIGASIGVEDSLAEGRSKFLAEVERLSGIVTLANQYPGEVLFLVDEVLSGTNSADRRVAAEAVVRSLVQAGAIGAMSTHDLKLAEIAHDTELGGMNVHMASPDEADPLRFDYLLKGGTNRMTNGLAIVRLLGLLEHIEGR